MSPEQNKSISKRWHEAWGTPALQQAYDRYLSEDFRALFFGQGWVDRATYIQRDQEFLTGFSDVRIVVEEAVAEGDVVMSRMKWTGVHTGAVPGIPAPTGKRFEIMGFGMDRFRDGKVVEHIPLFDQASLVQQLGEAGG
jgi:predicted ester cyclase